MKIIRTLKSKRDKKTLIETKHNHKNEMNKQNKNEA